MALSYDEAVEVLAGALKFGIDPSLEGITAMTAAMDDPQRAFASIQVTGTNGKTSVTRLTSALLAGHGARVLTYTSPHLVSYTERIEIDGAPVAPELFGRAIEAAQAAAGADGTAARTEFELLTAAALWLGRECAVDFAVLEVGMGGRWDATSVVAPAVSVITGVGLDHTDRLGATREEIAADKAHIIKAACTPVLGPGTAGVADILLERAARFGLHSRAVAAVGEPSPVAEELTVRFAAAPHPPLPDPDLTLTVAGVHADYGTLRTPAPAYQAANVATALAAAEAALGRALDSEVVASVLGAMTYPGRFEVMAADPPVVLDGAHNPAAAEVLAAAICDAWPDPGRRPALVFGVLADKDAAGMLNVLAPVVSRIVATAPDSPRAVPARHLAVLAGRWGVPVVAVPDIGDALEEARRLEPAGVVVSGSLYTAGEARAFMTRAL
jgi:dihydrofolate synthase/folylpolyglutamate synthase